jgi:16S rRNA processing protein RimM
MAERKLVVIGEVAKAFGVKGEVKVRPFTESLELFRSADVLFLDRSPVRVLSCRVHKGAPLLRLDGVATVDEAQALQGLQVRTEADRLPELEADEFYWTQLIGLTVRDVRGRDLGRVTSMIRTGANDVLEIHGDLGEILLPMIDEVIRSVDLDHNCMIVDPLEGLVPDA